MGRMYTAIHRNAHGAHGFVLRIIVLVIFISACETNKLWPYGYDSDDEGNKVIPSFVGENCDTEGYGGDAMGGGAYGGGSNGRR